MVVGDRSIVDGRFVLQNFAGSGGMGEVYKALDRESGLAVALKVMREGSSEDVARFTREARILSELDHPRIVRHIAHGLTDKGAPWLAMEWLDGEVLSARLARGRLTLDETVKLGLDIAEGLALAHARGVVHRDLKPSNIFLIGGRIDGARILDFGIAKSGVATGVTRTGVLIGTPGYMAPEQARGEGRIDARADVYSLGSVLFECMTGEPLFSGAHVAALLAKILFAEAPRVRDRMPAVPAAIDELLARMLAKEPRGRPENGGAVALALRSLGTVNTSENELAAATNRHPARSLTGSEKRSVAAILIGAPRRGRAMESRSDTTLRVADDTSLRVEAERHGGHCEFLLDGSVVVVLTGAALATDLAAQAARCAIALRDHAKGRPIALSIGRSDSTDKSPMDPVIDRAAKLCGTDAEHEPAILLDDVVAGLLDARFDVQEREAGFVLNGERELAEGTRTLLGKATPCVGRERELQHIEQNFEECMAESVAQVVLVTAPAGVGKSRLGQEFLRAVRDRGADVAIWIARGDSLRAGSTLGMLAQAVRSACGVLDGESLETRREKLRARVAERIGAHDRKRVVEFLGELMGTPFPDDDSLPLRAARLDAQLMTDQMRTAFLDFLAAECASRPVLILLEDLHWGDRPTIQFIDRALRDLRDHRLFVLALSRPEVRDKLQDPWAERKLLEIRLKELGRKAIERLVRHVLGESVALDTIDKLVQLSEGNAFYLEELIRFAAEGRCGHLPETVVAMVQSRLVTLDEPSRRVLRAASVFGEVSWTGGVAILLGEAEHQATARDLLAQLVEREALVRRKESRFPDEEEFAFRHALLREGAYAMLTEEDRALGHKLAGDWLETRGEEDSLLLAEHFEKGGDKSRAAHHYLRAVSRAYLAGDSRVAIAHAHRGLACVSSPEQRVVLLGMLCQAHTWHIDLIGSALPHANELLQISERGSVPWIQGTAIKLNAAIAAGRGEDFSAALRDLMEIEPSLDAVHTLSFALARGVIGLDCKGRVKEADVVMDRLTSVTRSVQARMPGVSFLPPLGIAAMRDCFAKEDPTSGLWHSEAARALAESIGDQRYREMAGSLMSSMNRWLLGACGEAERLLLSLDLPDEAFGYVSSWRPFTLAWILADRGALDEARGWASRLVAAGKTRHLPLDEGRGHWALAEVLRRTEEWDTANAEIETATTMLARICPLDVPGALATRAALRLAEGRPADALAAAEDGLARYESSGACSQFFRGAFLRLVHAEILEALGRHEDACVAVRKARECIQVNANKIGDPRYRESFLHDVPENRKTLELARQWLNGHG